MPEPIARLSLRDAELDHLDRCSWAVVPDFLDPEQTRALALACDSIWRSGGFREAGVGRGPTWRRRPEIRSDFVRWLEPSDAPPAVRRYFDTMEALRLQLNRRFFLGLFDFEAHFAVYPPGAFYSRHLDRFWEAPERTVSAVLYLNAAWRAEDGGALRLYPASGGVETSVDLPPVGGSLALFLSAAIPHEVLPTHCERRSITGWFKVRPLPG